MTAPTLSGATFTGATFGEYWLCGVVNDVISRTGSCGGWTNDSGFPSSFGCGIALRGNGANEEMLASVEPDSAAELVVIDLVGELSRVGVENRELGELNSIGERLRSGVNHETLLPLGVSGSCVECTDGLKDIGSAIGSLSEILRPWRYNERTYEGDHLHRARAV